MAQANCNSVQSNILIRDLDLDGFVVLRSRACALFFSQSKSNEPTAPFLAIVEIA
jgi:hypothetical protein